MPLSLIEVIDSAIKIGLGALISGVATYSVTRLKFREEAQQSTHTRKRELIETTAENLEKFNEFSHACSHSIFRVVKGASDPSELNSAADGLSQGISYVTKSLAKIRLLGETKIIDSINSYKDSAISLYNFVHNCGSKDSSCWDIKEFNKLVDNLTEKKDLVFHELSKSYLNINSNQ